MNIRANLFEQTWYLARASSETLGYFRQLINRKIVEYFICDSFILQIQDIMEAALSGTETDSIARDAFTIKEAPLM